MGALERLTYLLGICVAVIGWSVTQLTTSMTSEDVLGYTVSSGTEGNLKAAAIFIENLSKSNGPKEITVSYAPSGENCIRDFDYQPTNFALPIDRDGSRKHAGAERFLIHDMPPGSSFVAYAKYSPDCSVSPRLDIQSGTTKRVRLLQRGIETFVIRNEFGILLTLILLFGAVFSITFVMSYAVARK